MTDHGFISLGKFSSARDSILSYLTSNGWANESTGTVEAPTGWFAKISNDPADVHMPNTEITSVLSDWFEQNPEVTDSEDLRKELVGHFMVRENEQGFVTVIPYGTKSELDRDFEILSAEFNEWDEQGANDDIDQLVEESKQIRYQQDGE